MPPWYGSFATTYMCTHPVPHSTSVIQVSGGVMFPLVCPLIPPAVSVPHILAQIQTCHIVYPGSYAHTTRIVRAYFKLAVSH